MALLPDFVNLFIVNNLEENYLLWGMTPDALIGSSPVP